MFEHLFFMGNTAWGMYNFRGSVLSDLIKKGYRITVMSGKDPVFEDRLKSLGCEIVSIPIDSKGTNPVRDTILFYKLIRIFKANRPDFCFFYTIKPNIYGSMVAHLFGIDCITVTTGLGYVFLSDGLTSRLAKCLYKISLKYPKQVWFLNQEDRDIFVNAKIVSKNQTFLLKGEGVDLSEFCVQSINRKKVFLLIARLLWDKGVGEFVEAANILKKEYPDSHFQILGFINVENPSAISQRQMDLWIDMDIIEYLGTTEDVRPYIRDSTCIVLPSYYREGIPRSLMEAAAMGRPIITTNSVGCKEVVEDGVTGYLCEVKSVDSLVIAMRKIIHADIMHLEQMGMAGRRKMEREYDVNRIIGEYKRTLTDRFKA